MLLSEEKEFFMNANENERMHKNGTPARGRKWCTIDSLGQNQILIFQTKRP